MAQPDLLIQVHPNVRSLYDNERDKAWEEARDRVAGPEPNLDTFKISMPSKYPLALILLVVILCVIVLTAAFLPSSYRLHMAGSSTFCEATTGNPDIATAPDATEKCQQVGTATIFLAEVGQLVFFFALAVLGAPETSKRVRWRKTEEGTRIKVTEEYDPNAIARAIFWLGIAISTLIAIVGNVHVSVPWQHGGFAFAWIETLAPPLIVMMIGYVLKNLSLYFIERQRHFLFEYRKAQDTWKQRYNEPESLGSEWTRAYTLTLRNAIRNANRDAVSKKALAGFQRHQWQQAIKNEMLAGTWNVDPTQMTQMEAEATGTSHTPPPIGKLPPLAPAALPKVVPAPASNGNGHIVSPPQRVNEQIGPALASEPFRPAAPTTTAVLEAPEPGNAQPEVWQNDMIKGTWSARDNQTGYLLGDAFTSEAAAMNRLKRYRNQSARASRQ
jgi:hypothetical protein